MYEPLNPETNEVRLLTIHQGREDEKLICTLAAVELPSDDSLAYETISYAWDHDRQDVVLVNGTQLVVTASAGAALKCFRWQNAKRTVWIDCICINQSDLEEKREQVSLMYQIYRRSCGNLIYLENECQLAERAFRCVRSIAAEARTEADAERQSLHDFLFPGGNFQFAQTPLSSEFDSEAMTWMYQRRWFRRLWVMQEAVLAPHGTLSFGSLSIDLDELLEATAWIEHKEFSEPRFTQGTDRIGDVVGFRSAMNLWLFRSMKMFQALRAPWAETLGNAPFGESSEIRDQVFGLLGLYRERGGIEPIPIPLTPDYGRPAEEVIRDATRYAIGEQGTLSMIERLPLQKDKSMPKLPSWVSRWYAWHQPENARALDPFNPCGSFDFWRRFEMVSSADPNILRLQGRRTDVVASSSEIVEQNWQTTLEYMTNIDKTSKSLGHSSSAIGMTLVGGGWYTGAPALPEQTAIWPSYLHKLEIEQYWPPELSQLAVDAGEESKLLAAFAESLYNASTNRRFFSTSGGRIGIGPTDLAEGDVVIILRGGRLPFILRPHERQYTVLGPAYVHGIMWGEAIDESSEAQAQMFDII